MTHTTIEFGHEYDQAEFDGKRAQGRALERITAGGGAAAAEGGGDARVFRMVSKNNFPSNIGLGASASGFAALAVATVPVARSWTWAWRRSRTYARRGAGSASRGP